MLRCSGRANCTQFVKKIKNPGGTYQTSINVSNVVCKLVKLITYPLGFAVYLKKIIRSLLKGVQTQK